MTQKHSRKLFLNIPVRDLKRSMAFFTKLGFEFNPQFTDEKAACMIIGEQSFAMLITEDFFKTFTKKQICDTKTHVEGLFAISTASRSEVDDLVKTAIANGGAAAGEPVDHGFMYYWGFFDPDGHHWEPMYMDPAAIAK